jgi:hypothetical protein
LITFNLESPLQANPYQKFKIVSKAGDKGKKLLSHPKFPYTRVLGFREQLKERHDLLAEELRFSHVCETCN